MEKNKKKHKIEHRAKMIEHHDKPHPKKGKVHIKEEVHAKEETNTNSKVEGRPEVNVSSHLKTNVPMKVQPKVQRKEKELGKFEREVLEKYELEADGAKSSVSIVKDQTGLSYHLNIPEISTVTTALLNEIRNELVLLTTVSMKELTDAESFSVLKDRFKKDAMTLINTKLPNIESGVERFLVGRLIQEMLGLGKIEFLVSDPALEEIVIPSAKEAVRVYSKKYGWLSSNLVIDKEEDILNYANIIARRVGRQVTVLNPLLDAHLTTGDRVNAVLYPINTKGNTITIRKFARDPFTIVDMITGKTCDLNIASILWLATEYEMNVLISGGTGSGKTSFLNSCMPFVPPNQRVISIED